MKKNIDLFLFLSIFLPYTYPTNISFKDQKTEFETTIDENEALLLDTFRGSRQSKKDLSLDTSHLPGGGEKTEEGVEVDFDDKKLDELVPLLLKEIYPYYKNTINAKATEPIIPTTEDIDSLKNSPIYATPYIKPLVQLLKSHNLSLSALHKLIR